MMNLKNVFLAITLILITSISLLGCGGSSGGGKGGGDVTPTPSPIPSTTGSVTGVISFGEVTPSSVTQRKKYPIMYQMNYQGVSKVSNQKIIKFHSDLPLSEVEKILQTTGGQLLTKMHGFKNTYVVKVNTTNESFRTMAVNNFNVEYVEDDHICHAFRIPNDTEYSAGHQSNLKMMDFPAAWDVTIGDSSIIVAVLDTGVSTTHPDLAGKLLILPGSNFVDGDVNDPSDKNGHGTHVAGIIGANTDNSKGVAGICWNVQIMPVRVLDAYGNGNESTVAQGIDFAVTNGAKVINLSLGISETAAQGSTVIKQAIDNAVAAGVTVVAAAGNDNSGVAFPANYQPNVIAVAALDENGDRAPYSNYGPEITVCAPGGLNTGIYSTYWFSPNHDDYQYEIGTSMAAPHIAGLVALFLAKNLNSAPLEIKQHLQTNVIDKGPVGRDDYYGAGLPDAAAVLGNLHATKYHEVQVFVGVSDGTIEVLSYPDGNGNYILANVQPGIKFICAFLDTNLNGLVDTGDRFDFVSGVDVQAGNTVTVNIDLSDVIGTGISKTLSEYLKVNFTNLSLKK